MKALVVVQCFPPLLKNAGGVSKRYLTLCRALIDGLGWEVTLLTPVNIRLSRENDVIRWLEEGKLVHLPARGVRINSSSDGVAVFLDILSFVTASFLVKELCFRRGYDCVFTDDTPWRLQMLLLCRAMGVPTVVSTHTDITHMKSFKGSVKLAWNVHMLSTRIASLHATVSRVFGNQLSNRYGVPIGGTWPPILWTSDFKSEPEDWIQEATTQRTRWLDQLRNQGCTPKAIMLFAGRWSAEKRIHLLIDALPEDCALVIVGDGTCGYSKTLEDSGPLSGRKNVLPLRKMLNGKELRIAYAAADLYLSASNFETLGNTVIESWCSGTPCAIQPAQGHLEFVTDQQNSWFIDYNNADEAKATLSRIVASGLDPDSLKKNIPDFFPMGSKFRKADFALEFDKDIIQPALDVGQQQYTVGIIEIIKRCLCMIASIFLFFCMRAFTRLAFVTIRDPEFEVLGPLGGATDDGRIPSVLTYPCLRPFFRCNSKDSIDAFEQATKGDGTDYETHFEPARKKWSSKLASVKKS